MVFYSHDGKATNIYIIKGVVDCDFTYLMLVSV